MKNGVSCAIPVKHKAPQNMQTEWFPVVIYDIF